jgi:hypothetical protein
MFSARARTLSQGPDGKLSCTDSEPEEISGESNESDAAFNGH